MGRDQIAAFFKILPFLRPQKKRCVNLENLFTV